MALVSHGNKQKWMIKKNFFRWAKGKEHIPMDSDEIYLSRMPRTCTVIRAGLSKSLIAKKKVNKPLLWFQGLLFWQKFEFRLNPVNVNTFQQYSSYFALTGGFCKQDGGRWSHRKWTGPGRNQVPHQPGAHCVSALYGSPGTQWMSHHHRCGVLQSNSGSMFHLSIIIYPIKYLWDFIFHLQERCDVYLQLSF